MRALIQRLFGKKETIPEHLRSGIWGEGLAVKLVKSNRFKILGERVRVGKHDEIDIIARDQDTLVFIEVKTRASVDFGRPASAVDKDKRYRISRAAMRYMMRLRNKPDYFRFDIIEVIGSPDGPNPKLNHIPNAFNLHKSFRITW